VSTVYVGERTYPLTVRYTRQRVIPEALGNLFVNTAAACRCRCRRFADIRVRSGESTVTRENGQRNLTIRIDNRDRDLTSYLKEAQAKIAAQVHFDPTKDPPRVGRPVREPAARRIAPAGDPGPGDGTDADPF
jgi:cobalt-zinc-cadmium resistance protein CzcA